MFLKNISLRNFKCHEGLPQFQVIATTYSPATAEGAEQNEILTLRRDEAGRPAMLPAPGIDLPAILGMAA